MKAAAAAVCAENEGQGDEMKHRLFTRALNDEAPFLHARALGLDSAKFEACVDSSATLRRIEADKAILFEGGFRGLPTTFVGEQRIVGWRVYPAMKEAYELAAQKDGSRAFEIPQWLFITLIGAAAVGVGVAGRSRGNGLAES
jgi:predicted DsbA family dithiol-disulfide isomerase